MSAQVERSLDVLLASVDELAPWPRSVEDVTVEKLTRHMAVSGAIGGILLTVPDLGVDPYIDRDIMQMHVFASLITATMLKNQAAYDPDGALDMARQLWTLRSSTIDESIGRINKLAEEAGFDVTEQRRSLNDSIIDHLADRLSSSR